MTYDTAKQAADIFYEIEECNSLAEQLSCITSNNMKLSQILLNAITAIDCYKDELNRKLDEL